LIAPSGEKNPVATKTDPVDYASFRSFDLALSGDGSVVVAGDYARYPGGGYCVYVIQPQYDPKFEGAFLTKFDVQGRIAMVAFRFASARSPTIWRVTLSSLRPNLLLRTSCAA